MVSRFLAVVGLGLSGATCFAQSRRLSGLVDFYSIDVTSNNLIKFTDQGSASVVGPLGFDAVSADLTWHAGALYGLVLDNFGTHYIIQIETQGLAKGRAIGNFLKVGTASGPQPTVAEGLASDGVNLYCTFGTNNPLALDGNNSDRFGRVNPNTGVITQIGNQMPNQDWDALGGNGIPGPMPSGGFFANNERSIGFGVGTLSWFTMPAGTPTVVGFFSLGQPVSDLCFHPVTGEVYGMSAADAATGPNNLSTLIVQNLNLSGEISVNGPFSNTRLDGIAPVPIKYKTIAQIPDQPYSKYYTIDVTSDRAYSFNAQGAATPMSTILNVQLTDADLASDSEAVYVLGKPQFGPTNPVLYQLVLTGAYAGSIHKVADLTVGGNPVLNGEGLTIIGSTFEASYGTTTPGISNRLGFFGANGVIGSNVLTPTGADFDSVTYYTTGSWDLTVGLSPGTNGTISYEFFNTSWSSSGFLGVLNDSIHGWLDPAFPPDNWYLYMASNFPGFYLRLVGTSYTPVFLTGSGIGASSAFRGIARADQKTYL